MTRALLLAAAALCWPASSLAADCATHGDMLGALADQFHEQPSAAGAAGSRGAIVELLVSQRADGQPETWTLILTMPDGKSCLLASGKGWTAATPAPSAAPKIDPSAGTSL